MDMRFRAWDLGEIGWGYVDWIGLDQDSNRWRAILYDSLFYQSLLWF
jgi:hypothetical protein